MKKAIILHGYSADNAGDGLLIYEAISLVRGMWPACDVTVLARYPDSFVDERARFVSTKLFIGKINTNYLKELSSLNRYDLVIGVGGGYLRFGHFRESLVTVLAHGPQLVAAACTQTPAVYLPQSIGPVRVFPSRVLRALLQKLKIVALRDDRSVQEIGLDNSVRLPDMALLAMRRPDHFRRHDSSVEPGPAPVLSVRYVGGDFPKEVEALAQRLNLFDGFVQSRVSRNDDTEAMMRVSPRRVLTSEQLLGSSQPRVVIAMRLHAALMAMAAGHYVIHLAYERKGFGAFADLGLQEFVHNFREINVDLVIRQVQLFESDAEFRLRYNSAIAKSLCEFEAPWSNLTNSLQHLVKQ